MMLKVKQQDFIKDFMILKELFGLVVMDTLV